MHPLSAVFARARLFNGFTEEEVASALLCLEGTVQRYSKKQYVYREAERIEQIGIVLSGTVYICKSDERGGQSIYAEMAAGELLGEISLWTGVDGGDVHAYSAYAAEESEILLIQVANIVRTGGVLCSLRARIIENMLPLIVENNRLLYHKLELVSHKSLRQRILYYLELQARRHRATSFTISFSRADFADYLMVDRSALSRELCRMADDGLISFTRNQFQLHAHE